MKHTASIIMNTPVKQTIDPVTVRIKPAKEHELVLGNYRMTIGVTEDCESPQNFLRFLHEEFPLRVAKQIDINKLFQDLDTCTSKESVLVEIQHKTTGFTSTLEYQERYRLACVVALTMIKDATKLNSTVLTNGAGICEEDGEFFKFMGDRLIVGVTLPTMDDGLLQRVEPNTPSVESRLDTLRALHNLKLKTFLALTPSDPLAESDIADLMDVCSLYPGKVYVRMKEDHSAQDILNVLVDFEHNAHVNGCHEGLYLYPDAKLRSLECGAAQRMVSAWIERWKVRCNSWIGNGLPPSEGWFRPC